MRPINPIDRRAGGFDFLQHSRRLGLAVATLGLLVLAACGPDGAGGGGQAGMPPAPSVVVSTPVSRTITEWDEYTGRFAAVDLVDVRARVSGYLDSIHFKDGDIVYKGDLLFVIDPRPYQAALDATRAQVAQAQSRVDLAARELERARNLRRTQAVSETVLDQRDQELRAARAAALAAEAEMRRAELDVEFTQVKSPVTGRVSRHEVSVGNLVSGGQANSTLLTTIVSLDPIHFYFDADQAAYLRYVRLAKDGTRPSSREVENPVTLALSDETGFGHVGRMDFVDNRIDTSTGTIRGRAIFNNPDLLFTPGLFARIRLIGRGNYQALLLPDSAIGTDQTRRFVLVVGADNTAQYRPVEVGPIIDGLRVVRDGLQAGDRVIVSGLQRVRPGAPVNPVEQPIEQPANGDQPAAPASGAPTSGGASTDGGAAARSGEQRQ